MPKKSRTNHKLPAARNHKTAPRDVADNDHEPLLTLVTDLSEPLEAAEPPDMDAILDRLVAQADSKKRLTVEQIRREFPDIDDDPALLADLKQLLGEMKVSVELPSSAKAL